MTSFVYNKALLEQPLVPHVYGTEIEYSIYVDIAEPVSDTFIPLPPGVRKLDSFLSNGGRYYSDIGNHREYATPECATLDDIVATELAGEQIILHWIRNIRENGNKSVRLHKRNIDSATPPNLWGAHENYSTHRARFNFDNQATRAAWAAHLATRSIFTGSGSLRNGHYVIAQKLSATLQKLSSSAKKRPLVDTRDEPHANTKIYRRLHVSCGDANISPWAIWMKSGTTSLVLRMIEHGVDLSDLELKSPVRAALTTAGDPTLRRTIDVPAFGNITPLKVQSIFVSRARMFGKHVDLSDEDYEVIEEWQRVISDLAQDPSLTDNRVDWVEKLALLERKRERLQTTWHDPALAKNDLAYDLLGPDPGLGQRLRDQGKFAKMPSAQKVERAMTTPPPTRARLRGQFIMAATQNSTTECSAEWEYVSYKRGSSKFEKIQLDHPHSSKSLRCTNLTRSIISKSLSEES